jgi:hypothetical protein
MAELKILRHTRGNKKAYVVIMDAGFCQRLYFKWFRDYMVGNNDVLYKRITSEKDRMQSKLRDM